MTRFAWILALPWAFVGGDNCRLQFDGKDIDVKIATEKKEKSCTLLENLSPALNLSFAMGQLRGTNGDEIQAMLDLTRAIVETEYPVKHLDPDLAKDLSESRDAVERMKKNRFAEDAKKAAEEMRIRPPDGFIPCVDGRRACVTNAL